MILISTHVYVYIIQTLSFINMQIRSGLQPPSTPQCQYEISNPWSVEDMEGMPTKAGLRAAAKGERKFVLWLSQEMVI